jgi:hypothetical protein
MLGGVVSAVAFLGILQRESVGFSQAFGGAGVVATAIENLGQAEE